MKFKLLLFFIASSFFSMGQSLVLTQATYEPVIGDSSYYHILDTSAFSSGLPNAITGSASVWNYSNLISTATKANAIYVSPLSVSEASAYPSATVVQKQGNLYNFFKSVTSPTTQTELLGIGSNSLNLTFTNSAIVAKFPLSYGVSFTDNVSGTFNFSLSGTFNGSVSTNADGGGTLQLPDGVILSNVLRVKSVQTLNLNLGFIPFGTIRQVVYNYFHGSQKFPVLNITYSSLTITGSTTPSVSAVVTGNSKTILVGLEEEKNQLLTLQVFPNPAKEIVYISSGDISGELEVLIFDVNGTQVYKGALRLSKENSEPKSLSGLANGMYFLKLSNGTRSVNKKLVIQK